MEILHSGDNWRVYIEVDEVPYDDSYIDTWDDTDEKKALLKKELWDRIERDGVWGVVGEVKCKACGAWEIVDAVGGFVGDDWKDSGYDTDVLEATQKKANERL